MKKRIYFLDNLRTSMIFLVVVLHAGLVYEMVLENQWIVVDPVKNHSIGLVRIYLDLFIMFIVFYISGYFIPISVKRLTVTEFLKSKFKRIMLPWIIAVVTLIPAYKVVFLYSRGLPQEEWYSYFHVFHRTGADWSFFANHPTQSWLWFLPVLFLFQVAYMLLSKTRLSSLKISLGGAVAITFFAGLAYSMFIAQKGLQGWYHSPLLHFQRERLLIYFMAFLLGALSYKLNVFGSNQKNKRLYIWSNVVLTFSLSIFTAVALNLFFNMIDPARNYYFVSEFVDRLMYYSTALLSMLTFLYVFIYVFRFYLNKTSPLVRQLNNSSYSVYIIHMIVMGLIALPMISLPIPAMLKFLVLTLLTFAISNLLVYLYQRMVKPRIALRVVAAVAFTSGFIFVTQSGNTGEPVVENVISQVSQDVDQTTTVGLHEAVLQDNLEAIKQHIQAGSDLDVKEPAGGSSPLITAALFGKTDAALVLIEAGADVNLRNNEGSTPLHTAAFFCRTLIVEALLENGADVSIRNNAGSTALESVQAPYEIVGGFYEYFQKTFGDLGLDLNYEEIKTTRPGIAEMIEKSTIN